MKSIEAVKRLDTNGNIRCSDLLGLIRRGIIAAGDDPVYFRKKVEECFPQYIQGARIAQLLGDEKLTARIASKGVADYIAKDSRWCVHELETLTALAADPMGDAASKYLNQGDFGTAHNCETTNGNYLERAVQEAERHYNSHGLKKAAALAIEAGSTKFAELYSFLSSQMKNREMTTAIGC